MSGTWCPRPPLGLLLLVPVGSSSDWLVHLHRQYFVVSFGLPFGARWFFPFGLPFGARWLGDIRVLQRAVVRAGSTHPECRPRRGTGHPFGALPPAVMWGSTASP